jgi:hypothetical protein
MQEYNFLFVLQNLLIGSICTCGIIFTCIFLHSILVEMKRRKLRFIDLSFKKMILIICAIATTIIKICLVIKSMYNLFAFPLGFLYFYLTHDYNEYF